MLLLNSAMSGNINRMLEGREELPTGQVAPVMGTGAPPTTALGALSEGDRASGSRVEPDASLVHATLGSPMQDGNVRANASVLSGAGLDGPAGPGVGATGVTGAANAAGAAPAGAAPAGAAPVVTGSGLAAGGQGGHAQGANGTVTMSGADMATLIGQAIAHVLASHPATSGVSPQVCLLLLVHVRLCLRRL